MAEDFKDPRDVDWHPRRRLRFVGHADAEKRLLLAAQSEKLHHAWLLTGPRGIGKATLAYRFARYLSQPRAERRSASLDVEPESTTARLLAAGAHPNIHVLERKVDTRNKRLKTEIAVDDARLAIEFISRTSATGGWRVIIVDSADDLNTASANALLKVIEEPPDRSIFLLLCHRPGSLMRTIRSRCLRLALDPLDAPSTLRVLQDLPSEAVGADHGALAQATDLARGSPGRALDLIGSKGAAVFADFRSRSKLSPATCVEIAAALGGRASAEDVAIFMELLTGWLAEQARAAGLANRGVALAEAHDDIVYSLRQADALNLERRQTVTDALMRIDEALKAS
ncbi:MAG: DNA polymerase III subunit delta' [Alphaproteobacteria bacterium]|nr:DNA polymerase III subunit delta' [Alphaproteobacteria bacterium]